MINSNYSLKATQTYFLLSSLFVFFLVSTYPSLMLIFSHFIKIPLPSYINLLAGALSSMLAIFLAYRNKTHLYLEDKASRFLLFLTPFFIIILAIYVMRDNFGIYDIVYPTDLIGMTIRASQGLIPLSFSSFPDFPANYHQAFLILAGAVSNITKWDGLHTLVVLFPALSILSLTFLFLITREAKQSYAISFICMLLFLFASSFPMLGVWTGTVGIDGYEYLMFLDIYFSNTWVLGSLIFFIISLLLFWKNDSPISWQVCLLLFCLISANATLFITAWVSILILGIIDTVNNIKQKSNLTKNILFIIALLGIYWISKYIPSAFLKGSHYAHVDTRIKYLKPSMFSRDMTESFDTLRLTGPWILLTPFALVCLPQQISTFFNKSKITIISFAQITFLFSSLFPLIITIDNINRWDAVHKFAVTSMLTGFIFLIHLLRTKTINKTIFYIFTFICCIGTYPHIKEFTTHRLKSFSESFWINLPSDTNQDLLSYLQTSPKKIKIYPVYQVGSGELNTLASFSGNYIGNAYYPGFLVKIDKNDWPDANEHWSSAENFYNYLKATEIHNVIAVEKDKNDQFIQLMQTFNKSGPSVSIDYSHPLVFKNYVLYNYSKSIRTSHYQ